MDVRSLPKAVENLWQTNMDGKNIHIQSVNVLYVSNFIPKASTNYKSLPCNSTCSCYGECCSSSDLSLTKQRHSCQVFLIRSRLLLHLCTVLYVYRKTTYYIYAVVRLCPLIWYEGLFNWYEAVDTFHEHMVSRTIFKAVFNLDVNQEISLVFCSGSKIRLRRHVWLFRQITL